MLKTSLATAIILISQSTFAGFDNEIALCLQGKTLGESRDFTSRDILGCEGATVEVQTVLNTAKIDVVQEGTSHTANAEVSFTNTSRLYEWRRPCINVGNRGSNSNSVVTFSLKTAPFKPTQILIQPISRPNLGDDRIDVIAIELMTRIIKSCF